MLAKIAVAACLAVLAAAPAGAQENPSFNLLNRGGQAIKEVFVTPAGDANWGRNRLEGRTIAPGASFAVRRRVDGNCVFDIRTVFADGSTENRRNLNTCSVDDVAVGAPGIRKAADDPSFKLVNRGVAAISEAFASPAGSGDWGRNRLPGPLAPKADRMIELPKGACSFDLRVVFEGGRKLERKHADLCRMTDVPVP